MEPEFLTSINAKTALETPQTLVQWEFSSPETPITSGVPWNWITLYLRRSSDKFPESISDGDSVYSESFSSSPTVSVGDLNVDELTNYYYSLLFYYRNHTTSTIGIDSDISRIGSFISGVVKETTDPFISKSDGVKNGTTHFTSATANFRSNHVTPGNLLRITGGTGDIGYHEIVSVDSETQIIVSSTLGTGTGITFEIYTDHKIFWFSGADFNRNHSLWRYDSEIGLVTDKINLSSILSSEEFINSLAIANSTNGIGFCTNLRWVRIPLTNKSPGISDILSEVDLPPILISGYQISGCTYNTSTNRVYVLDTINMSVQIFTDSGSYVSSTSFSGLDEVTEGSLQGISISDTGTYLHVGNRNYIMEFPVSGSPYTSANISKITYTDNLISADLDYFVDPFTASEYLVTVDNTLDKLRTYTEEYSCGGIWQQPYIPDSTTIALYHLDGNANDSSINSYTGSVVGMTSYAGRFGLSLKATSATDHVTISAIAPSFNGDEGSASIWVKATTASDLTSGTHKIFSVTTDANNNLLIGIVSGSVSISRTAAGSTQSVVFTISSADTEWHCYECTWSKSADAFKVYFDGVQQGTTQTGLSSWSGAVASAYIGGTASTLLGCYDECRIKSVACVVHTSSYAYTKPNEAHAFSGRSYTKSYDVGDPMGFFYRDEVYTPKFIGGDYIIRNDYERDRISPLNKVLSSGETIFRGPSPLPVLGDVGRLSRLVGLFLDRVVDDRHCMLDLYDLLKTDIDSYSTLANNLGLQGLDNDWNVDKQRRFLRIMPWILKEGGCASSYRILARLLGFYATLYTLQARRRFDSVYYNAHFDSEIEAIPFDTMGSLDTGNERFPLALLRFLFYKLSLKSSTGVTSIATNRLLTDTSGSFSTTAEVGNLIVIAQGQLDAGSPSDVTESEYIVEEVQSNTVLKVDRNWESGGHSNVIYYNFYEIPSDDPYTDFMLTKFMDIAPDSMRVERYEP